MAGDMAIISACQIIGERVFISPEAVADWEHIRHQTRLDAEIGIYLYWSAAVSASCRRRPRIALQVLTDLQLLQLRGMGSGNRLFIAVFTPPFEATLTVSSSQAIRTP